MMTKTFDDIRREKAKFARNVEYIRETSLDDIIDERVERAQSLFETESVEELEEAASLLNRIEVDDELAVESVEVQRLLDADENITFNEMADIQ